MKCVLHILLEVKITVFLRQHYKQIMPAQLQSVPNVCGFYSTYAAFQLLMFCQEEITGVQDFNVLRPIKNFKSFANHFILNVQSTSGIF